MSMETEALVGNWRRQICRIPSQGALQENSKAKEAVLAALLMRSAPAACAADVPALYNQHENRGLIHQPYSYLTWTG